MIRFIQVLLLSPACDADSRAKFVPFIRRRFIQPPKTLAAGSTQSITAVVTSAVNSKDGHCRAQTGSFAKWLRIMHHRANPADWALLSATAGGPFIVNAACYGRSGLSHIRRSQPAAAPMPISSHPRFLFFSPPTSPRCRRNAAASRPTTPCKMLYDGAVADVDRPQFNLVMEVQASGNRPALLRPVETSFRENRCAFRWCSWGYSPPKPLLAAPASGATYGHDVWVYVMTHVLDGSTSLPQNHWSDDSYFLRPDW